MDHGDTGSGRAGGRTRHEDALLETKVRRVMRVLAPYGVLRQDTLARACGARRWDSGAFRSALDAGVRDGRLRRLPLGFYSCRTAEGRRPSTSTDGRR